MPATTRREPAIDGWFATDNTGIPHLIGSKCPQCGTYVFPPRATNCPNPTCDGNELEKVPLSRRGTLWSYTENRYAPPPPYPAPEPFEPFAVAAVELADEGLIVLGKVVEGTLAADLRIGIEMELATMPLFTDDDGVERIVYAWAVSLDASPQAGDAPTSGHSRGQHRRQAGRTARAGDDAERCDEGWVGSWKVDDV